jgi:hypothetical protein
LKEETMKRRGRWALVPVLLLVNGAAMWGQAGWGLDNIVPAGWVVDGLAALTLALAFAAAIELIGVFLSLSADDAEDRGLPSGGIRLGSYAIGVVSGALNYSHWDGAAAVAFALLSAISPFLWGINSRVNRSRPIAPSRRFWHPRRSIALIRHMAWAGIALEQDGIESMRAAALPSAPKYVVGQDGESVVTEAEFITEQAAKTAPEDEVPLALPASTPLAETGSDWVPRMRTPRGSVSDQLRDAVLALMDADNPLSVKDAAEKYSVPRSTVGRYGTLWAALKDSPQTEIPASLAGKVKPELVALVRDTANRRRVR